MQTGLFAILLCLCAGLIGELSPARAQVSGSVTLQSDDRFRGRSVSNGEPVLIGSISYDDESGIYAGGSLGVTTNGSGVGVLRGSANVGYAHSLNRAVSLDTGVVLNRYTDRYSGMSEQTFVETYAGVSVGPVALYAWYSPSYIDQGLDTLYLEANAVQDLGSGFRANVRAGVLRRLGGEGSLAGRNTRYDAQVGLTKDFAQVSLSVLVGTAGPSSGGYFSGPWQGRNSVLFAASHSF